MSNTFTLGIHHLGLTVSDVKACSDFFCEALGFKKVGEKSHYPAIFVSDGSIMLTLWQVQNKAPHAFDRKNTLGLHHFALRVKDDASLQQIHQQLSQRDDVKIEFSPEAVGTSSNKHMMCEIPGGLRMELIALATE